MLVTDHHLPAVLDGAVSLPDADVIVNPNQPGCAFDSKAIAGVGVMFYVLLATRAELRQRGAFAADQQPKLDTLLDLVAQGLKRVRAGRLQPGLLALFNAAGRLSDMTLGIECLRTDDPTRAAELAAQLDAINRERREVESGMRERAEEALALLMPDETAAPPAVALFDSFHEGVVGIVAGRVKDRLHRPTFVFARGADGQLKGSGRSIPGFHLRDALDLMAKREPGLLLRFGGHAMAAGCTLAADPEGAGGQGVQRFGDALRRVATEWLDPATLTRTLSTDGPLALEWFNAQTVALLDAQVWGQGFEAPVFCDEVQVLQQRLVGEKHLKLKLLHQGQEREAIWFSHAEPLPATVKLTYRINLDEWNGRQRVQMVVEAAV